DRVQLQQVLLKFDYQCDRRHGGEKRKRDRLSVRAKPWRPESTLAGLPYRAMLVGSTKLKYRTAFGAGRGPEPAVVPLDDRSANRQAHAHAVGLGREQRIENAIDDVRVDSLSSVRNGNQHAARFLSCRFNTQDPRPLLLRWSSPTPAGAPNLGI